MLKKKFFPFVFMMGILLTTPNSFAHNAIQLAIQPDNTIEKISEVEIVSGEICTASEGRVAVDTMKLSVALSQFVSLPGQLKLQITTSDDERYFFVNIVNGLDLKQPVMKSVTKILNFLNLSDKYSPDFSDVISAKEKQLLLITINKK